MIIKIVWLVSYRQYWRRQRIFSTIFRRYRIWSFNLFAQIRIVLSWQHQHFHVQVKVFHSGRYWRARNQTRIGKWKRIGQFVIVQHLEVVMFGERTACLIIMWLIFGIFTPLKYQKNEFKWIFWQRKTNKPENRS